MGAYRYVVTTKVVTIDWTDTRGILHRGERAAVAIYAFKPWTDWAGGKENRRMHFAKVQPWINAWKKSKEEKPTLVVIGERDEETGEVHGPDALRDHPAVWRVRGGSFIDDYTPTVGRVVSGGA